jgi:hypothetical protein
VIVPAIIAPAETIQAVYCFARFFQEPDWKKKKRRNVELSRAKFGFWPLFGRQNRILLWSGADCKFGVNAGVKIR